MFNSRNEREREREKEREREREREREIISSEYSFKSCYEFIISKRIEYINAPKGN